MVHDFAKAKGSGLGPEHHLVKFAGLLYGVTEYGGAQEGGAFFSFDPQSGAFEVSIRIRQHIR